MTYAARQRQLADSLRIELSISERMGQEESRMVEAALTSAVEKRASLAAEGQGRWAERERILAILRKYAACSLTVQQIIKEIQR